MFMCQVIVAQYVAAAEMEAPATFVAPHQDVFPVGKIDLDLLAPGRITVSPAQENQLIPLGSRKMNPIKLEASYTRPLGLKDALLLLLDNNLPIKISRETEQVSRWRYYSSLAKFLPNIESGYLDQYQRGIESIGGRFQLHLNNPYVFTHTGIRYYAFRGGAIWYGSLARKHLYRAATAEHHTTISDALLEASRLYYAMVLSDVLLQIRIKAVETSVAQLTQNKELKAHGTATSLDVLQSQTQLARDRQALIVAEVNRRNAAVHLGAYLNVPSEMDFALANDTLRQITLIDDQVSVPQLLDLAIRNRPELRRAEEERLAAKRNINVAAAPLAPKVSFYGDIRGSGATLSPSAIVSKPGLASVALTGPVTMANVLGNTELPLPDVLSAAPLAHPGVQPVLPAAVVRTPPQAVSTRIRSLFVGGFDMNWDLEGLGGVDISEVQAAKAESRRAMLRYNDQLVKITEQVRTSYLSSLSAATQVEETSAEVASALEELRFAQERVQNGVGTNVDVITAQRDYTSALVAKAQSIIDYNVSQIQLLHDIGLITVDSVVSGKMIGTGEIERPRPRS